MTAPADRRTLEQLLADAEAKIERLSPADAAAALGEGATLVDIRAEEDRRRDGIVPGSIHIPRTVLEWRFDPASTTRSPYLGGLAERVVLICDHGCSSIFAAAVLVDLGFTRAADVVGGFEAWREAGLPTRTAPPSSRAPGELAGMGPPAR